MDYHKYVVPIVCVLVLFVIVAFIVYAVLLARKRKEREQNAREQEKQRPPPRQQLPAAALSEWARRSRELMHGSHGQTGGSRNDSSSGSSSSSSSSSTNSSSSSSSSSSARVSELDLISSVMYEGTAQDTNLINPWGIAVLAGQKVWVADNGTGLLTQYDLTSLTAPAALNVVTVLPNSTAAAHTLGKPTALVANASTTEFKITANAHTAAAQLIVATEDGTIAGFNSVVDSTTAVQVINSPGKVFTGAALQNGVLFVANFADNVVEMYDPTFTLIGTFGDSSLTSIGYAPFNLVTTIDRLYVTFAQQNTAKTAPVPGLGNGYIDVFSLSGTLEARFASRGALNAPWGLDYDGPSSLLYVGNFGDGHISVYNTTSGDLQYQVEDAPDHALSIDGLWSIVGVATAAPEKKTGKKATATSLAFYFSAGIVSQTQGLLGLLKP